MSPLPRKKKDNEDDQEPDDLEIHVELDNPEAQKQQQHRIDMLVRTAGFDHWYATRIANISGINWRDAAALKAKGCPQELVLKILKPLTEPPS